MIKISLLEEIAFREGILSLLEKSGEIGELTGSFIRANNILLKFRKQKHSAAAWTLGGNIHLNIDDRTGMISFDNPYLLSLVVHETHHLKQGILTSLSVYGELDAWQVGFSFYKEISGSALHPVIKKILGQSLNWSREELMRSANLMKEYSPGYRIDLLPLYPIHLEIAWRLFKREPKKPRPIY